VTATATNVEEIAAELEPTLYEIAVTADAAAEGDDA
jgi:hypothetical protein